MTEALTGTAAEIDVLLDGITTVQRFWRA